MRVTSIFVLAILCSAALAAAPTNVDMCMYDKVSRMTEEGQKLAFFLTRTAIVTSVSTHTEVSYSTHTTTQYISSFVNSEEWVSTHGGWNTVCNSVSQKCHNKRGKTVCRKWKRSCKSHGCGFKWTVGRHIVVNNISVKPSGPIRIVDSKPIKRTSGKKIRRCNAFAANPRKRVCIRRNKSKKCVKFTTFYRINKCLSWKRVVKNYTRRAGTRFSKRAYLRVIRQRRATFANKVHFRKWRRDFRRKVRAYGRRHRNFRIRKSFFRNEKKYRICRRKMAKLAKSRKWIVKMDAYNVKRRQRIALRLRKYRAIKDVRVRKLKMRKFKIYRKKSKRAFKRSMSLKLAKGCGCKKIYLRFNKSRKSLRRIKVKGGKRRGGRFTLRVRGGKRIAIKRRVSVRARVSCKGRKLRGCQRGNPHRRIKYKVLRRPILTRPAPPTTYYRLKKVTVFVATPAEVKSVFIYSKRGPARKIVRKVCAKRFRKWSAKAKKFRCISRGGKYVIRRCKTFKITKKGKIACAKRVKVYGIRICKKRAFRNRRIRCVKRVVSYPKARCIKRTKRGTKRFCLKYRFYRPTVFCARYKKFSGKRRCVSRKTFAGKKFFKIRCAKTKRIIKVRKGKKCGCKKYKVSIRRKYRLKAKSLKFKCMKCAAWKRAQKRRMRFNKRVSLKIRGGRRGKKSLKIRVRGGRRGKKSLKIRVRGGRRSKSILKLRVKAPRRACVRVSKVAVIRKPSVSVRVSCKRGRKLQAIKKPKINVSLRVRIAKKSTKKVIVVKNVQKRLAEVKAWYKDQMVHQQNYINSHKREVNFQIEVRNEEKTHWKILLSKKRMTQSTYLIHVNNLKRHIEHLRLHYKKHETWRLKFIEEEYALRLKWANYQISDEFFTAEYRKIWIKRHEFYQTYYETNHKRHLSNMTRDHKNRMAEFKRHLKAKRWTLALYKSEVARWTERYSWDYESHKTWYHIHDIVWHKYHTRIHKLLWSKKISQKVFHQRYHTALDKHRAGHRRFRNYRHKREQQWRHAEFLTTAAQYKRNYKNKVWSKFEFEGRYNCLVKEYNMRRRSYNRFNHISNVYHETIWNTKFKENILFGKKVTHAMHVAANEKVRKLYVSEYKKHLKIVRFLANNCTKSFEKVLKKKLIKKPVKIVKKPIKPVKKPVKVVIRPHRPVKYVIKPYRPVNVIRPYRPTRRYRWTKWTKITSESKLWKGINFQTVFDIKNSSVEYYAKTIKQSITKFSQVDQILINKCF